jgi:hypothetical protein
MKTVSRKYRAKQNWQENVFQKKMWRFERTTIYTYEF